MRRALKQVLQTTGGFRCDSQRSRIMSGIRGKGNRSTERKLRAALVQAGINGWQLNAKGVVGVPDVWFSLYGVAIFVDGCFWHGCPLCGHYPKTNSAFWRLKIDDTRQRDARQSRDLRDTGIRVLRLWEHEVMADLRDCVSRIEELLRCD